MIITSALDPGRRECGWAVAYDGRLADAGLARCDRNAGLYAMAALAAEAMQQQPHTLYVEKMQVYRHGATKGDPAALVELSIIGGMVAGILAADETRFVTPRVWKGQVPKKVHHARLVKQLSTEERELLDEVLVEVPVNLRHNVLDAVGVLLYGLGRKTRR